ncbi:unnamed protein product [Soboliphyme baturini]|uniref:Glycine N-acyltransferase-like protein n=1 Tax=Soboliphyme baturini TaxID=241478 RepID=A0A183J1D9_9BILA|nr:unnamed protein product [Soboliphyme baturini]
MVVELVFTHHMKHAIDHLLTMSDPYRLPVCGMVYNVVNGSLPNCHVFVDMWPNFKSMVCVRSCDEYGKPEMDFATWYSPDMVSFEGMFRKIADMRKWFNGGRGVILHYVNSECKRVLANEFNVPQTAIACDSYSLYSFDLLLNDHSAMDALDRKTQRIVDTLPDGFEVGQLQAKDIETVARFQGRKFPDKVSYYQWLIQHLPSVCVRNSEGHVVAWKLTYDSGTMGALFVLPEFRKQGLALLIAARNLKETLTKYNAIAAVAESNEPCKTMLQNHFHGKALGIEVSWIICE